MGFILYDQGGAETTRRFVFQLLNNTLDLIKLSFLKQFFSNCFVLRAEKLTVAEVVQNVPSSKTVTIRNEFQPKAFSVPSQFFSIIMVSEVYRQIKNGLVIFFFIESAGSDW